MKKLLILALLFGSLYITKAQTSGWVMDLGDGVYYWNSWENSHSRNVKGNSEANDLEYKHELAEMKLKHYEMVKDSEGVEYLLRNTAFLKKYFGNEYVHDFLTKAGFTLVENSNNNVRYYKHGKNDSDNYIDIIENPGVTVASITTTNNELFLEETNKIITASVDHYTTSYGESHVLHELYGDIALKYINVSQFDGKSDMFNFFNTNIDGGTFGVIYTD